MLKITTERVLLTDRIVVDFVIDREFDILDKIVVNFEINKILNIFDENPAVSID